MFLFSEPSPPISKSSDTHSSKVVAHWTKPDHPNGNVEFYVVKMGDKMSFVSGGSVLNCTLTCDHGMDLNVIAVNVYPSDDMDFNTAFNSDLPVNDNYLCEENDYDIISESYKKGFSFYKSDELTNPLPCSSRSDSMIIGIPILCIFVPIVVFLSIYKVRKCNDIKVVLPPGLGFGSSPIKNNSANISPDDDHDVDSEQTMETTENECSTLTGKEYIFQTQDFGKVLSEKPQPQFYTTNSSAPVIENFTTNKDGSGYIKIQPDSGYIKIPPNAGGYISFPLAEPTKVSFQT